MKEGERGAAEKELGWGREAGRRQLAESEKGEGEVRCQVVWRSSLLRWS